MLTIDVLTTLPIFYKLRFRMSSSITRIADFLNAFSKSCSGRLSYLDARLTSLERKVTFLEAKVGVSEDSNLLNESGLNDNDAQRRVSDESEEEESYLDNQRLPAWNDVLPSNSIIAFEAY